MTEGAPTGPDSHDVKRPDLFSPMSPDIVRDMVNLVESSDVEELEIRWGETRIRVRQDVRQISISESGATTGSQFPNSATIVAPLTGVYYARPSPDQPPFVNIGDTVTIGQIVALIETMKLFNEVLSDVEGVVIEIPAMEGAVLERGQTILTLDPSGVNGAGEERATEPTI